MQKSKILAFLLALVVSIVLWFYAVTVVNPDDTIIISGIMIRMPGNIPPRRSCLNSFSNKNFSMATPIGI